MTFMIGQQVEVSAQCAEIVAIDIKRGKQLVTVRFSDGSIRKTPAAFVSVVEFAPAEDPRALVAELRRESRARTWRHANPRG